MKKTKFVTLRQLTGKTIVPVGSILELTEAQAMHPLYKNRIRPMDAAPEITPAVEQKDESENSTQGAGNLANLTGSQTGGAPWNQG